VARLAAIAIREAADIGQCIIVGRGGQCVLQGREDVFHVFVYGSTPEKAKRIQHLYPTVEAAKTAIRETEQMRNSFIRSFYGCDWGNRKLYNLMINSDIGFDAASKAILSATGLTIKEGA
jgi:cytidylate kinase